MSHVRLDSFAIACRREQEVRDEEKLVTFRYEFCEHEACWQKREEQSGGHRVDTNHTRLARQITF